MDQHGNNLENPAKVGAINSAHIKPIKILQLRVHPTSYLAEQIKKGLPSEIYEVTNACLRGNAEESNSIDDKSKFFDITPNRLKGLKRWLSIWLIYNYCKNRDFDLFIAHRFKPIHIMLNISKWLNVPLVGIVHGFGEYDKKHRKKVRKNISTITTFVAVSEPVKQYLTSLDCGFTNQNTSFINNAIDISAIRKSQLSRSKAREVLGIPPQKFILGSIGRIVPVKGYMNLLEAFKKINFKYPDACLLIVGDGRQKPQLEEYIAANGLSEQVFLVGWKQDAFIYAKAFDVFVMTSLSEGLPLALLEAMCGSVPIIGTDINTIQPIINQSGGSIFSPNNPEHLSKVMQDYLKMPASELGQLGKQSYQCLLKHHSIETFQNKYRQHFEQQLGSK